MPQKIEPSVDAIGDYLIRPTPRLANDFERRPLAREAAPETDEGPQSVMELTAVKEMKRLLQNKEMEYRSLEDSFRLLMRAKRQQEEEFRERERLFKSTVQAPSPLLEDTLSIDSQRVKTRRDSDMPGESRRMSSESDATTDESSSPPAMIVEAGHPLSNPTIEAMSARPNPIMRPTGASSPAELYNPFTATLPRRPTGPPAKAANRIKPKSEIRIYGRGRAQNMGIRESAKKL
jgi:hypothetical protein